MVRKRERERERERERQQGLAQPLSHLTPLSLPESTYLPTPYAHLLYARFSLCNRSELPGTKVVVFDTSIVYHIDYIMFCGIYGIILCPASGNPARKARLFLRQRRRRRRRRRRAETVPQVPSPRQERRIPLFFSFPPPHTLHYSAELIIALIYKGKTEEEEIDKKRCFCCCLYEEEYAAVCRRQVKAPNQGKIKSESRLKR